MGWQVRCIAGSSPLLSGLCPFGTAWLGGGVPSTVMPVLVTGIHAFVATQEGMDARDEREHEVDGVGKSPIVPKPDSNGPSPAMTRKNGRSDTNLRGL
jgi:hypothetical protein